MLFFIIFYTYFSLLHFDGAVNIFFKCDTVFSPITTVTNSIRDVTTIRV